MALTKQTMTNEQRKSVAVEYLKAFDNGEFNRLVVVPSLSGAATASQRASTDS